MYSLGSLIGSIGQGYAAAGLSHSAANAQSMQALGNSQMANMQSAMQAQQSVFSQSQVASYRNALGSKPLLDGIIGNWDIDALRQSVALDRAAEPTKADYAAIVQPSEHELKMMQLDENLAALKKKTAEIHADVKARVFASRTD